MIKILIADDHAIIRKGLKQIISEDSRMTVTAEAGNGQEVLDKIRMDDFDLLVLDITMPGRDGIEIIKQLKTEKPKLPVLVLSMHPEQQYALRVLKAGAAGYLSKESAPEELIGAIQRVSEGRKYISDTLAEILALDLGADAEKSPHERLSDREYQVMCLLAVGKTTKQIAEDLVLSVKTINTYRSRVFIKMNLKNNSELIYYAIKNGLVE